MFKVVSGGQTGADQAGLLAALWCGIPTGGWAPEGFLTETGNSKYILSSLGLVELPFGTYTTRTIANVRDSDATAVFALNFSSPGTILTLRTAEKQGKPIYRVDLRSPPNPSEMVAWLRLHNVRVLNVAGNSQSKSGPNRDICTEVLEFLVTVFTQLNSGS